MSWSGYVAGASHYRGRVEGPHPSSCHGTMTYNHPDARSKYTCEQRHEIPARTEWDVEDFWSDGHWQRYAASHFEIDGPGQFKDELKLITVAAHRFLGTKPDDSVISDNPWWEARTGIPDTQPGDRLWYGTLPWKDDPYPDWPDHAVKPEWGALLATKGVNPDDADL